MTQVCKIDFVDLILAARDRRALLCVLGQQPPTDFEHTRATYSVSVAVLTGDNNAPLLSFKTYKDMS